MIGSSVEYLLRVLISSYAITALKAQDAAPDTVANTVLTQTALSGTLLPPNISLILASNGRAYRFDQGESLLVNTGTYTWQKSSANSGVLRFETGAQVSLSFGAAVGGTYRDASSSGVFFLTSFSPGSIAPLRNISSRASLLPNRQVIAGFVVAGSVPRRVLVRAIGPSLSQFSVPDPAPDPELFVAKESTVVGTNTSWGGSAALAAAFTSVGAFALPSTSRDCALLLTLPPGNYTANARSSTGGEVLVEVYYVN